MRTGRLGILAGAAMFALVGCVGSASAAVMITIDAVQSETAGPPASPFQLMTIGTGTANSFNGSGVGSSFGGWTITSATPNSGIYAGNSNSAASVFGQGNSTTDYLAAIAGGTLTLKANQQLTSLNILWGTVDSDPGRNVLVTTDTGTNTINGATILGLMQTFCSSHSCGPVTNGDFEAYISITGLSSFDTVTFSDTSTNSFEFLLAAVPEPSTWAMMILGFLGVGFLAYRKQGTLRIV